MNQPARSGILLILAAVAAIVWANLAGDSYSRFWQHPLALGVGPYALSKPLLLWINDGLMTIFFLLVGLEIKRETLTGELASTRKALVPIVAAIGGMVAPAAIYSAFNAGGPEIRGWGIPTATDIAFALGVVALLGNRVPRSLRVFLTAIAIADDLGAVVLIAIFYSHGLAWMPLQLALVLFLVLVLVNRTGIGRSAPYVILGAALWLAVLNSGVHATVAGVLLAFTIPSSGRRSPKSATILHTKPSLLERLEHGLEPWVAFGIMPIFALANAGVRIASDVGALIFDPVALGIVLGLFLGKQLGVVGASWIVVRLARVSLPSQASWRQLYGVSILCGIGFTMSLFIATLAFGTSDRLEAAKIGVLGGSLLSGVIGYFVLARATPLRRR